MSHVKQHVRHGLNRLLHPMGAELVPVWWQQQLQEAVAGELTFEYFGKQLPFFLHQFNCGGHPLLATERTVELAIADNWISEVGSQNILEIGAVTPYYWPRRISHIADPFDTHPLVTERTPVEELELQGKTVLSISTFEHFGTGDYGLPHDGSLFVDSLRRLYDEAARFLVTMPLGYNPAADNLLRSLERPADTALTVVARQPGPPFWSAVTSSRSKAWTYSNHRANAVAILQRPYQAKEAA